MAKFLDISVCRKPKERVSLILVMLMSRNDSDFERWNICFKENKPDDVDLNSDDLDYCVRNLKQGKIPYFSADSLEDI